MARPWERSLNFASICSRLDICYSLVQWLPHQNAGFCPPYGEMKRPLKIIHTKYLFALARHLFQFPCLSNTQGEWEPQGSGISPPPPPLRPGFSCRSETQNGHLLLICWFVVIIFWHQAMTLGMRALSLGRRWTFDRYWTVHDVPAIGSYIVFRRWNVPAAFSL